MMKIRYYVCGLGFDKNHCITDYEREFGDFDTEEEALDKFDEAVREAEDNLDEFFRDDEPKVAYWHIQIEKCEETEEVIECVDVLDEADVCKYYDEYIPSSTRGDYSPSNPWDAPGMSVSDFI